MKFSIIGHDFKYELEKVCRLFMPFEKFEFSDEGSISDGVFTKCEIKDNIAYLTVAVNAEGSHIEHSCEIDRNDSRFTKNCELSLAKLLHRCLCELTGYSPEWGIVTGIRPVRLLERYIGLYGDKAEQKLVEDMMISKEKLDLTKSCLKSEEEIIEKSEENDFSLYISIPFCPSRCNYCSFVSHSVEQAKKLIPEYVDKLCEEIEYTAKLVNKLGLHLRTAYMGGGTPTVLDEEKLDKVLHTVWENFDIKNADEFTVEAGRPDTVTREKLEIIKKYGATRISINPQTMNDEVLKAIGRRHTTAETVAAYRLARDVGFDNINTDLIAGLTSDTVESFKKTVDEIIALNPENVTVHTLSLKRASNMTKDSMFYDIEAGKPVGEMLRYAAKELSKVGIYPYYMYRQGKTVGNLENVGYAKVGYEGLYNVYIMDETHTILACGASAVTKLREYGTERIERVFNYKYPYEYLLHYDEVIKRKSAIEEFYGK